MSSEVGRRRVTLVPPGPVAAGAAVEVRVAVPDGAAAGATRVVAIEPDGTEHDLAAERGDDPQLLRTWWHPAGVGTARVRVGFDDGTTEEHELEVLDVAGPALPWFQGAWLDPFGVSGGYGFTRTPGAEDARAMITAMAAVGIRMVVVTYVEYLGTFAYPSDIEFFDHDVGRVASGSVFDFDLVEAVLDQADREGMHVFLGLGRSGDTHLLWEFDDARWDGRNATAIDIATRVADELWRRYGQHPSLYGWYLTHEMNDLARASAYYDPVCAHVAGLAPGAPVLVAPAGTPIVDRDALARSRVDIFAYQDAVGAGYVPNVYTYDPRRRIETLDEIYAGYRAAHRDSGKHLWADLEIWEMDGSVGYTGAYPPSWERVAEQLKIAARHVDLVTAYEWSGFMDHPGSANPRTDPRALELYTRYAAYHAQVRGAGADGRSGVPA